MEATMFSYWIYDVLAGSAAELHIAHPLLVKAITAGKHKSDKIDARKLADIVPGFRAVMCPRRRCGICGG
jgi:transposase